MLRYICLVLYPYHILYLLGFESDNLDQKEIGIYSPSSDIGGEGGVSMMLENTALSLNKEYRYKDMMSDLGWNETTGYARKRQIAAIEDSFDFYHPLNERTGKPKKSYVFTGQKKQLELIDDRRNNGRKSAFPEYAFSLCLAMALCNSSVIEPEERDGMIDYLVFTTDIYRSFGLNPYDVFKEMRRKRDDKIVLDIFKGMVLDAVRSNSLGRIARTLGCAKNSLPKVVVYSKPKNGGGSTRVRADWLNDTYERYIDEYIEKEYLGFYSREDLAKRGALQSVYDAVHKRFKEQVGLYGVCRANLISVEAGAHERDWKSLRTCLLAESAISSFCRCVIESVTRSIERREFDPYQYSVILRDEQIEMLWSYLSDFKTIFRRQNSGLPLAEFWYDSPYEYHGIEEKDCSLRSFGIASFDGLGGWEQACECCGFDARDVEQLAREVEVEPQHLAAFLLEFGEVFNRERWEYEGRCDECETYAEYLELAMAGQESLHVAALRHELKSSYGEKADFYGMLSYRMAGIEDEVSKFLCRAENGGLSIL